MLSRCLITLLFTMLLSSCASNNSGPVEKTIADLPEAPKIPEKLEEPLVSLDIDPEKVIESYEALNELISKTADNADVMRRLADLELQSSLENKTAEDIDLQLQGQQESLSAIERYQAYLKRYPSKKDNDVVLYQLSKAYALESRTEEAQQVMDQLVAEFPNSRHIDEVQFRRGENLFVSQQYAEAEKAYGDVVENHPDSPFYDKALYKYGWTHFKQNRNRDALVNFVKLLDSYYKAGNIERDRLDPGISRGNREFIGDILRVVSLAFSYEFEKFGIPEFFAIEGNRAYEPLLYRTLGDLYLEKDRIFDAANNYLGYVKAYPYSPDSYRFQQQVIEIFRDAGYQDQVLLQKIAFINNFDIGSQYWHAQSPAVRRELVSLIEKHYLDIATHYHARARITNKSADYGVTAEWYKRYIDAFPYSDEGARATFLLGESLFEAGNISAAIDAYEKSAYKSSIHENSAEAGYATLLAYTALAEKSNGEKKKELVSMRTQSALRFGQRFPDDDRAPLVLLQAAEQFFSAEQYEQAIKTATGLTRHKLADRKTKQSAWTFIAHSQFATEQFARAEKSYLSLLKLLPVQSKLTRDIREQVAASIYKQGESAVKAGNQLVAARHFARLGSVIAESPKRRLAEYDAATAYIELQDWPAAIKLLESFRKRYPDEKELKSGVTEKLALAYSKNGDQSQAAREMIRISKSAADERRKELMWAAAGLYESAGEKQQAISVYKSYIKAFPRPLDRAVELRHRIAEYYKARNDRKNREYWLNEIITADADGNSQRTDRTRYLAATASMELIRPVQRVFDNSKLTIPLRQSLRKKKALMEQAIAAYSKAIKYQVAEVTTEATHNIAKIYNDFATALLNSERPRGLDEAALEEYQLLLEEQAFPFEEKAIDIHVTNIKRIPSGFYDDSIKSSLAALGKLLPFRYAKKEMSSGYIEIVQ